MMSRRTALFVVFAFLIAARQGSGTAFAAIVGIDDAVRSLHAPASPTSRASSGGATEVREVFQLNAAIREKQRRLEELRARIARYRASIGEAQARTRTLQGQLAVTEDRITKKSLAIEAVQTEREQVELEVRATRLDLDVARSRTERLRALLTTLLARIHTTEQRSPIAVVLASASIGESFAYRDRLTILQSDLRRLLGELREQRDVLHGAEVALADRQEELRALAMRLTEEQDALREEQEGKQRLLGITRRSEARYQQFLAELREEQGIVDREITDLDARVRTRLTEIDKDFGALGRVAFTWPTPNRGITTHFHDPEYPFRHIFEHPGIDIRAGQGSSVTAAAPGYVARVKDAGYGYSYIMLIHPGGFSTVYGHLSQLAIEEGTYVTRGQLIAYSGGRPGSRGAGRLTTGPHLHLEVRVNGIPVDPLGYLL